jgi:hypothetical protein
MITAKLNTAGTDHVYGLGLTQRGNTSPLAFFQLHLNPCSSRTTTVPSIPIFYGTSNPRIGYNHKSMNEGGFLDGK